MEFFDIDKHVEADKKADASGKPRIKHEGHIMLSGPTEAAIGVKTDFVLSFFLFGDIRAHMTIEHPRDPKDISFPLHRDRLSDDGTRLLRVLYACFENAVEAHVKVKITNVTSAFDLYGVIAARTSAIKKPAYSSILFFKDHCEKMPVKRGDGEIVIPLSRPIVAVPLGSKLILQFGLSSDGNDQIVEHYESIDVTEDETSSKSVVPIPCRKCALKVEIKWRSKRESKEY